MRIVVAPDREGLALAVADRIADLVRQAIAERSSAHVAFSGGHTPAPMLRELSSRQVPWSDVVVLQVDERVAPDGHAERNATMLQHALLDRIGATAILMPVTAPDLAAAALQYEHALRALPDGPRLDVVHLGLGADGHTASLVPGDAALRAESLVATTGSYEGRRRMTLTYPVLNQARHVVWEVAGESKAEAVRTLLAGGDTPAAGVSQADAELFLDAAAASGIPDGFL